MDQEEGIRQTDQVPPTADWRAARALTERRERVNRRDVSRGSLMGACVKEFGHARTHLYTKLVLYTTNTQTRARALTLTFSHSLYGSHAQSLLFVPTFRRVRVPTVSLKSEILGERAVG